MNIFNQFHTSRRARVVPRRAEIARWINLQRWVSRAYNGALIPELALRSKYISPLNEPDEKNDDGNHQQNVDEAAHRIGSH